MTPAVEVGNAVRIVGEEHFLTLEVLAHRRQTHPDVRLQTGVDERDAPILDVSLQQLHTLATLGKDEVVGQVFVVVREVALDRRTTVPEAQNEVLETVVRVVLHQVPDDRPRADLCQWFGDGLRVVAEPHAETATEQYDFQDRKSTRLNSSHS